MVRPAEATAPSLDTTRLPIEAQPVKSGERQPAPPSPRYAEPGLPSGTAQLNPPAPSLSQGLPAGQGGVAAGARAQGAAPVVAPASSDHAVQPAALKQAEQTLQAAIGAAAGLKDKDDAIASLAGYVVALEGALVDPAAQNKAHERLPDKFFNGKRAAKLVSRRALFEDAVRSGTQTLAGLGTGPLSPEQRSELSVVQTSALGLLCKRAGYTEDILRGAGMAAFVRPMNAIGLSDCVHLDRRYGEAQISETGLDGRLPGINSLKQAHPLAIYSALVAIRTSEARFHGKNLSLLVKTINTQGPELRASSLAVLGRLDAELSFEDLAARGEPLALEQTLMLALYTSTVANEFPAELRSRPPLSTLESRAEAFVAAHKATPAYAIAVSKLTKIDAQAKN